MDMKGQDHPMRSSVHTLSSDQKFLLNFIMSTYLGPDVKADQPRCSAVQRLRADLPPYSLSDMGPSYVSISLLERLYYYLLRDAHPDLVIEIWYPEGFRIIKGIVFIDNPVMSYIEEGDIDRFKSLSGKEDDHNSRNMQEKLSRREGPHVELDQQGGTEGERNSMNNGQETISNGECLQVELDNRAGKGSEQDSRNEECSSRRFQRTCKRKRVNDTPPIPMFPHVLPTEHNSKKDPPKRISKSNGPTVMPLLSIPDIEDSNMDSSLLLTGTARRAPFGPSVGVVDIGTSKVAYLFRVSLPGVKKDYSDQFSCEVESDGKVHIQGVISGGRIIVKQARVFEMKFQQLCCPGPFTLSFSLPGPVDPRLFAPNFRSDGIFEAAVIKAQQPL
ncbi:hypothetical protein L6164_036228 [Bauhinia variegata]|uniref:Uncharacterized protein n=1 Tax=Bauhinia variegata TaxID=167791 RepID=A0ACB9KGH4_BAUVA|nr:hypothetical protein L6164_036228 [Bauhinia variegata]